MVTELPIVEVEVDINWQFFLSLWSVNLIPFLWR